MILKNCRYLVTQNKQREILEQVDVLIEGSKIVSIGKDLDSKSHEIIDCTNKIVMPGLINTHCHNSMQLLKGVCDDKELHEWLDAIVPLEKGFTKEQLKEANVLGIKEMIASGTTMFVEGYYPAATAVEATKEMGMRAIIFLSFEDMKKYLPEQGKHELISFGVSGHSIYRDEESLLVEVRDLSKKYKVIKGMHLAETRKERFDCMKKRGCLPVEYLEKIGWLDKQTLLSHCVWLTKGELKTLKKYNTKISHCPVSNMKLASGGVMPLPEMIEEGLTISLGTDSVASNNNLDMFEELKITGLLHKHHRWDPKTAPVQKILDMATIDAAKCLGMEKKIGSIEEGKEADIITIDLKHPKMQPTTKQNLLSNIIYCANGNDVEDTVVAGKLLMKDKQLNI